MYLFFFIFIYLLQNGFAYRTILHSKMVKMMTNNLDSDTKYNLNWYVIGDTRDFIQNKLYSKTIWNKKYVVWKTKDKYYAMDDTCSHRGVALSRGKIFNGNVVCPYHGYQFNNQGVLAYVPGLNFTNTPCQNIDTYEIVDKNGWVYMNTISKLFYKPNITSIFEEPESKEKGFSAIFINKIFKAYSRIVSENSLDVMHIGFVHTFGNTESPSPITEIPPFEVKDYPFHYKTIYSYLSGKDSIVKKIFDIKQLIIENEFVLPHTTIARVKFGELTSTVMTFALPINETCSQLFVKTYRNFWTTPKNSTGIFDSFFNWMGDLITIYLMRETVNQDKGIIESIPNSKVDGKFNMKYDKLQNTYSSLYKKYIHKL